MWSRLGRHPGLQGKKIPGHPCLQQQEQRWQSENVCLITGLSGISWRGIVPRSPLLLCDSVQTQTSLLPAQKWEVQIMLHDAKTSTVILVIFPRQEQSLHQVCQKQEEGCQMTLESKCQMTKENRSTGGFVVVGWLVVCFFLWLVCFLFQHCQGNCSKTKIRHRLRACRREISF